MSLRIVQPDMPSIGFSDYARQNCRPELGHSYTILSEDQLIELAEEHWQSRSSGDGETGIDRKVIIRLPISFNEERWGIPANTSLFIGTSALLHPEMVLSDKVVQRQGQTQEDYFIAHLVKISELKRLGLQTEPVNLALIVLYSKEALQEKKERSIDVDWEIITILTAVEEYQPMLGLTMARNHLNLPGGTLSVYTADAFAKALIFWEKRVQVISG
jgi:hypothetical protein